MPDAKQFLDEISRLLGKDLPPPVAEVRRVMVEMDEYFNTPEFQALSYDERAPLQNGYKELRSLVRGGTNANGRSAAAASSLDDQPAQAPASNGGSRLRTESREHNPYAEQQMEEAEKLFYGGRYAEAIKLYDQVLQIEPGWERAQKHRNESENYLRTGYIPSVALPADAGTAFGKAQSAARLGRFSDAMALLNKAQSILRDLGIQRWQEGQEFEQKLQQSIDAESVFQEGIQLFNQGQVDDSIDRVETAARASGLPRFSDKAQEMHRFQASVQSINEALNSSTADARSVAAAKIELDGLLLHYDQNPILLKLKQRMESSIPHVIQPLKDQIRALKAQADKAQTLEALQSKARQARQVLDQARSLGPVDEEFKDLHEDIDRILQDVTRFQDELQQANVVLNTNRSWPASADRMSRELRGRFPNDPGVMDLNRGLSGYHNTLTGIKVGGIVLAVVAMIYVIFMVFTSIRGYFLALTPTSTATPTLTFTPTHTLVPTLTGTLVPTATHTPSPSPLPSPSATPLIGTLARLVWARSGCYDAFDAVGRIPEGANVRFLPSERRFDTFSRECVLVEFDNGQSSVIGWILIADLVQ
jgi:tetratricopeptide (TPR) repeat protein